MKPHRRSRRRGTLSSLRLAVRVPADAAALGMDVVSCLTEAQRPESLAWRSKLQRAQSPPPNSGGGVFTRTRPLAWPARGCEGRDS